MAATPNIVINGHLFEVEVADEFEEWRQGLSGHAPLESGKGMLFVFNDRQVRRFWMKDMLFPLDIIWIDGGRVAGAAARLAPEGPQPKRNYASPEPVQYVLEVASGTVEALGIEAGDEVTINL